MQKFVNIYLISGSSGEALYVLSRYISDRLFNKPVKNKMWTLVISEHQINSILDELAQEEAIIVHIDLVQELKNLLKRRAKELGVECFELFEDIIYSITHKLEEDNHSMMQTVLPSMHNFFDEISDRYNNMFEAIGYTVAHDDGAGMDSLNEAEIIILGPSRTAKSPTSIYLAYQGFKTANIPLFIGSELPDFSNLKANIFGLTISPERLMEVRKRRSMGALAWADDKYVDAKNILQELDYVNKIYVKNRIPILDVTNDSTEEIASRIISLCKLQK